MNEINVTWSMIAPELFFERSVIALIGAGMAGHFMCMASAAPVRSPLIVMIFLMVIVGSSVGMFMSAIFGDIDSMYELLISGLGSMFLFWMWLWSKGMHVKDLLDEKYDH